MISTDILLIGAGPIGLETAIALKRVGAEYLHLEAGQIAQTVTWYPHQTRFFSSPERIAISGLPLHTTDQSKATREEYLAYLRCVVQQMELDVRTYETVDQIKPDNGGFLVRSTRSGQRNHYFARRIVLAIGDMAHPRLLHIPGEDLAHVSHYFQDPHKFFRQRVLIVGGRNSAVEAAIRCHRVGAKVSMSYRRESFDKAAVKYWLLPEIESMIRQGEIAFYPRTAPRSITPGQVTLGVVDDADRPPGAQAQGRDVEVDFVLLLTGYVADTTLFEMLGVELEGENHSPRLDAATMESNVPGVYVVGTAVAGTQERFRLFIENCHIHVSRVVKALTGQDVKAAKPADFGLPES